MIISRQSIRQKFLKDKEMYDLKHDLIEAQIEVENLKKEKEELEQQMKKLEEDMENLLK